MIIVCVDAEPNTLMRTIKMCKKLPGKPTVFSFSRAKQALKWFDDHYADIALLDTNMPDLDGMSLAAYIKEKSSDTSVIFVSDDARYAVDAFGVRAVGFVLKPLKIERLRAEVAYAMSNKTIMDRRKI